MVKNVIVPIPAKKISYKKTNNPKVRYVYYITRHYRNEKGTPTCDERLIGKEYPDKPGWMVPNKNYFAFFPNNGTASPMVPPMYVRQAGQGMFLTMLAENLGLKNLLEDIFPDIWRELFMCAVYMTCQDNVMMNTDFFWDEIQVPEDFSLPSRKISELFCSIKEEDIMRFFKKWSGITLSDSETVAYDVTSVSTYSGIETAEYGYNRDKEGLPQINFGMLFGSSCKLPVAYALYSGSINDLTFFPYMMHLAGEIGVRNVFYVMDRGFVTQRNLQYAKEKDINFLAGVPKHEKIYRTEMAGVSGEVQHPKYRIPGTELNGMRIPLSIDARDYELYVYYNKMNAALEENRLFDHIERLEAEIKNEMKPKKHKRFTNYYDIKGNEEGTIISYEKDYEKIAKAGELAGIFGLLGTKPEMTPTEALNLYKGRDGIEKIYDVSKNELESDRLLVHSSQSMRGKYFVHFIALILWSDIQRKVKKSGQKPEKTIERILLQMKKVKCLNYEIGKILEEPLTKKQKDILACCDINIDDFIARILSGKL